jgi:hypothetical protein
MTFSIPTLILVTLGAGAAVTANMLAYVMTGQINEKVAQNERLRYLGWDSRIRRKHRQLYPESKLVYLFDACGILMVVCFLILGWRVAHP